MAVERESDVVAAFVTWLEQEGWRVSTEVDWADVVAERGSERLVAEAKGKTSEPGSRCRHALRPTAPTHGAERRDPVGRRRPRGARSGGRTRAPVRSPVARRGRLRSQFRWRSGSTLIQHTSGLTSETSEPSASAAPIGDSAPGSRRFALRRCPPGRPRLRPFPKPRRRGPSLVGDPELVEDRDLSVQQLNLRL